MTIALAENAAANGCEFRFDTEVQRIRRQNGGFLLETSRGPLESRTVICAAGVHGDTLHNQLCESQLHIVPRRGEYCLLDPPRWRPGAAHYFPAALRHGQGRAGDPHGSMATCWWAPLRRIRRTRAAPPPRRRGLRRVAETASRSVRTCPCGMSSPALPAFAPIWWVVTTTSSWARARRLLRGRGHRVPRLSSVPHRRYLAVGRESWARRRKMTSSRSAAISPVPVRWTLPPTGADRKRPRLRHGGRRCEEITEGEIREAIRRGARSLDGVKRRVRAGMGRCQGGFCTPRVLELLHEELGTPMTELTKCGGESRLLAGRTKEVLS